MRKTRPQARLLGRTCTSLNVFSLKYPLTPLDGQQRGDRQWEDAKTLFPRFSPEEFVAECFRKTSPDLDEEAYSDEGEDDSAQKET